MTETGPKSGASSGSVTMHVTHSETGLVRLFALDLPKQRALALKERSEALAAALGVAELRDGQWEIFDLTDLAGMGLEAYLSEGHGIPEDDLAPFRWQLDALEGVVFILRTAAFPDRPVTLTPRAPLRWVATFGEEKKPVPLRADLPSESARGQVTPPAPTRSRPRGSLVVVLLGLILTFAIAYALFMLFGAQVTTP